MLPSGHFAAGYLLAKALIHYSNADFSPVETHQLLFWGAFFGFAPDLDTFYAFWKIKRWIVPREKVDHRKFITHAPLLWLAIGLLIYFLSGDPFVKYLGLLVWLGPWSHFALDSTRHGIMWLWPFSKRLYALKESDRSWENNHTKFFRYWLNFLRYYITRSTLTFGVEVVIISTAVIVFLSSR